MIELFEKKIFSCPLFQSVTIYKKNSILNIRLHFEYASGTINYFCKRLHFDVWLGSRYASDMFKNKNREKPVKELFLEMLQLRLRNHF